MATRSFPATKAFLIANLAVFVLMAVSDAGVLNGRIDSQDSWYYDLGLNRYGIAQGELWRLVTAGFIHFGIIHLAFNCLALWNIGQMLEPLIGARKFALLYMASLLAGSAGAILLESNTFSITGGASGAVFGLFGATAVALRHHGINPLRTSIGTMLMINLVLTFSISGISIGGHIGGLLGGAACGAVLTAPRWRTVPAALQWAVPLAVIAVSVGLSIAVSGSSTG